MPKKRKETTEEGTAATHAAVSPIATAPAVRRELSEEEKRFLDSLTKLVTAAQELSYALAAIDTSSLPNSPEVEELVTAARNVVRAVWEFHKLVKTRMGRG